MAFGTIAAIELARARQDDMPPERLSEQFLHERMLSAQGLSPDDLAQLPEGGILLSQAFLVLREFGLIRAEDVPYKPDAVGLHAAGPTPSPEILAEARNARLSSTAYGRVGHFAQQPDLTVDALTPGDGTAEKILRFLNADLPVVVGVPLFVHPSGLTNWTLPAVMRSGQVFCPQDAEAPALDVPRQDGHVVCLTGFVVDPTEPMGGWFTFWNSWGLEFSHAQPNLGPAGERGSRGYGWISATHLDEYCWEYLVPIPDRK